METTKPAPGRAILIRAGGLAMLLSFAIHIGVNFFLKELPPIDPSIDELKAYFEREAETWGLVHGLRNVAVAGMLVFLGALYARTAGGGRTSAGWEVVGLLGGALHAASLFITNSLETFAFFDFAGMSERPELFWLVFHATRVLFTAEVAIWAVLLFGFSMAGLMNRRLPTPVCALGLFAAAACLLSGLCIRSVLAEGPATIVIQIAEIASLLWFLGVGVFMALRGDA